MKNQVLLIWHIRRILYLTHAYLGTLKVRCSFHFSPFISEKSRGTLDVVQLVLGRQLRVGYSCNGVSYFVTCLARLVKCVKILQKVGCGFSSRLGLSLIHI